MTKVHRFEMRVDDEFLQNLKVIIDHSPGIKTHAAAIVYAVEMAIRDFRAMRTERRATRNETQHTRRRSDPAPKKAVQLKFSPDGN